MITIDSTLVLMGGFRIQSLGDTVNCYTSYSSPLGGQHPSPLKSLVFVTGCTDSQPIPSFTVARVFGLVHKAMIRELQLFDVVIVTSAASLCSLFLITEARWLEEWRSYIPVFNISGEIRHLTHEAESCLIVETNREEHQWCVGAHLKEYCQNAIDKFLISTPVSIQATFLHRSMTSDNSSSMLLFLPRVIEVVDTFSKWAPFLPNIEPMPTFSALTPIIKAFPSSSPQRRRALLQHRPAYPPLPSSASVPSTLQSGAAESSSANASEPPSVPSSSIAEVQAPGQQGGNEVFLESTSEEVLGKRGADDQSATGEDSEGTKRARVDE